MAENKPKLPVVHIDPKTKEKLDGAVRKYYDLLKAGKNVGESEEADEAAKELAEVVDEGLEYDPETETWGDKKK